MTYYYNLYANGTVGTLKNCRTQADLAARPHPLQEHNPNPRVALIKVTLK